MHLVQPRENESEEIGVPIFSFMHSAYLVSMWSYNREDVRMITQEIVQCCVLVWSKVP